MVDKISISAIEGLEEYLSTMSNWDYIINGNFKIRQRGINAYTGSGYGGPDRWFVNQSGAGTSFRSVVYTDGATLPNDVIGEFGSFARFQVTSANDNAGIWQKIEDVTALAGKRITVTFWARNMAIHGASPTALRLVLQQNFGTGGSNSNSITLANNIALPSEGFERFSFSIQLPDVRGMILGDANHNLTLKIENAAFETWHMDITKVSLEEGDTTSRIYPLPSRHSQQELALCQWFFRSTLVGTPGASFGVAQPPISTTRLPGVTFAPMRTVPSIEIYSPLGTLGKVARYNATSVDIGTNFTAAGISRGGFLRIGDESGDPLTLSEGFFYCYMYTAEAEL